MRKLLSLFDTDLPLSKLNVEMSFQTTFVFFQTFFMTMWENNLQKEKWLKKGRKLKYLIYLGKVQASIFINSNELKFNILSFWSWLSSLFSILK